MDEQHREERIEMILEAALRAPAGDRDALLDDACDDDADLRAEVAALIAAHEASRGVFDRPSLGTGLDGDCDDLSQQEEAEAIGSRYIGQTIGQYRVTRVLGIGGMGAVFEAEQDHPRRAVALKVMRGGLHSTQAARRFRYEAEILGSLHHPNIAQVYDAGMHDDGTGGVPYFAMEKVTDGRAITEYADAHGLDVRERIALFIKVCNAVHYGHQKGIMHRDLKPANVLVDERGEPKVIDFGVARATDVDISVTSMQTDAQSLVGTARYMSPEQCTGRVDAIDTRSDVYALGVMLYELLTGDAPYEENIHSVFDATRVIAHGAIRRPTAIDRTLRGDIETILLKSLAHEPERRYQSAAALADDLQRHLDGEPIAARPPSRWQRTCRWIGRHPVVTSTCAAVSIAVIVLGLTASTVYYIAYRPDRVEVTEDGRAVRLISRGRHVLHEWTAIENGRFRFGHTVSVPDELGGGRLVILGYSANPLDVHPGAVCAYDMDDPAGEPRWIGRIEPTDIPERLRRRGFTADDFFASRALVVEQLFADHPGPHIVVSHTHEMYSQDAIRIYDAAGNVLYQAWHDGTISDFYWMRDAQLLVVSAVNGLVYWHERDVVQRDGVHPGGHNQHPQVVFAFRPERGRVGTEWICTDKDGPNIIEPAWYRCLFPFDGSRRFRGLRVRSPSGRFQAGRTVGLNAIASDNLDSAITFYIDEHGNEIPDSRVVGDNYFLNEGLPDPDVFYFDDLPSALPEFIPGP